MSIASIEDSGRRLSAAMQNPVVNQQLNKLGKFSVVLMPTRESELKDILIEDITVSDFVLQLLGSLEAERIFMISRKTKAAREAAFALLEGRDKAEDIRDK